MTQVSFKDLSLSPQILTTLDTLGFVTPTDIQAKAIPLLLSPKHVDFWGQAQTGTGKTLAFGIPLIQSINASDKRLQALIVAPTRELVVQIMQSLRPIAQPMGITVEAIYGGASMRDQMSALKRGIHIIVGTPGRINDHLSRKTLSLANLRTLVLDEADIMLDMGFKEEVDEILSSAPAERQIWLFSATVKPGISGIMREHMKNTVSVAAAKQQVGTHNTKQFFCLAPMKNRFAALCRFIDSNPSFYGFIFCQTKILTAEIAEKLAAAGYPANALHGDMSQGLRNAVIKKFKNKEFALLVATDVAARGIDVSDLTHVINYSLPNDPESYLHRIGRTGRAGKEGIAISFIGSKNEQRYIRQLENKFKVTVVPLDVPSSQDIQKVHLKKACEYVETLAAKPLTASVPDELRQAINAYSPAQLSNIVVATLAEKFFPTTRKDDFHFTNTTTGHTDGGNEGMADDGLQELMIHLGTDDGISREDVAEFLTTEGGIDQDTLEKLKVIKRRTFIKLPREMADDLMNKLKGKSICGHKARITLAPVSDDDWGSSGPRRSSGGRGRSGGRSGGSSDRGERGSDRGGDRRSSGRSNSSSRKRY